MSGGGGAEEEEVAEEAPADEGPARALGMARKSAKPKDVRQRGSLVVKIVRRYCSSSTRRSRMTCR